MSTVGMWDCYVRTLMADRGDSEASFAAKTRVQQGTLNRWLNGKSTPDKAAHVAAFARKLDRNPLEAFVAAGMLDEDEAGRGLAEADREFLARVRPAPVVRRGRAVRTSKKSRATPD